MLRRWIGVAGATLAAGLLLVCAAGTLVAQQRQDAQPVIMNDEQTPAVVSPQSSKPARRSQTEAAAPHLQSDPNLDADDQLAPSQVNQPMPAAVPSPSGGPARASRHAATPAQTAVAQAPAAAKPQRGAPAHIVDCKGVFAKNSNHLRLAMAFESKNIAFTEVDGGSGNKVMATVLFGKDPKQRLEVWWSKPNTRSDTYLVVINGQSSWAGPDGLKLGLGLRELEKLNKKPFKLKGFNSDGVAMVSDWDGGALSALPGGCRAGVSVRADLQKNPVASLGALPADHEYTSDNPAMRIVNPTVSEILVGY